MTDKKKVANEAQKKRVVPRKGATTREVKKKGNVQPTVVVGKRKTGTVKGVAKLSGAKKVWINPGKFQMGSPANEPGRWLSEKQHWVKLSRGFWMWQTEVTQGQFQAVMGYNPSYFSKCGPNCPVERLSWHEAVAFVHKLSKKQGKESCFICWGEKQKVKCKIRREFVGKNVYKCRGWRLPTEAEWEYAYRAGSSTPFYTGRCLSTGDANYHGNYPQKGCPKGVYRRKTTTVKSFRANQWGLYDMAGNVWEWCWDWYGTYPSETLVTNPAGPSKGSDRVRRGGSWEYYAWDARAADRLRFRPSWYHFALGFRPVVGSGH